MNIYNYNHLFYFYITAKLNGVTLAAKHLNTSQSSLSMQLKTLESVLGKPLFKKAGRKIELTEFGVEIYSYCRRTFEIFDEMFDQIHKKNSSMGIRIAVGVSLDIDRPFVTEALAKLTREYAKEQRPLLNLISLPSNQLMQLLSVGEVDLLLTSQTVPNYEIENIKILDFPIYFFGSNEIMQLSKSRTFDDQIRNGSLPFVLPSKITVLRTEIDNYFFKRKINPIIVFESNVVSSVVRAASDGVGATIMPAAYLTREIKSGRLFMLKDKPLGKHRMTLLSSRRMMSEGKRIFAIKLAEHMQSISTSALPK